jgi:hypothetical protein
MSKTYGISMGGSTMENKFQRIGSKSARNFPRDSY